MDIVSFIAGAIFGIGVSGLAAATLYWARANYLERLARKFKIKEEV